MEIKLLFVIVLSILYLLVKDVIVLNILYLLFKDKDIRWTYCYWDKLMNGWNREVSESYNINFIIFCYNHSYFTDQSGEMLKGNIEKIR